MKTPGIALVFITIALCAAAAAPDSSRITEISLERTPCYGTCPVYKVTLHADGTVTYEGKEFVKEIGTRSGRISASDFQQLARQVQKIDFFSLKDEYRSKKNPNGSILNVTDLPTRITTVKKGDRTKTVENYFGGPDALKRLEEAIDRISGSAVWVNGKT